MKMKRLFLSLTAAATLCGAASAQTLSVANVEALPGETVSFALTIDVEGGAYSGFQFQMQFPAEGFSTAGTTISSDWDGGSLGVGDLMAGEANASASSMSDTAIPDGERVIGTVKFTVGNDVPTGNYDVTISNFNFLDGTNYTPVADVTFSVHVVNVHSLVLDETSTTAPEASDGAVNVRVKRTIKANEWSTICLPFAMDATQMKAAFGDDVELGDFTGYETTEDDGGDITGITVKFNSATAIEANHPYIIKISSAITEFTADGVTIDPQEAKVTFGTTTGKGKNAVYHPSDFVGTYVADFDFYNDATSYPLFLNASKFWYASENTMHMKAYRAYFDLDDYLPEAESASAPIYISFNNDVTGIQSIQQSSDDGRYYNLNGQHVTNLKKGLYIKNGKKVVVK